MICLDALVKDILIEKIIDIKSDCSDCHNSKCKLNFQHSSTDALYVLLPSDSVELYFIEFKKKDLNDPSTLTPRIERFLLQHSEFIKRIAENELLLTKINWQIGTDINIGKTIEMLKETRDEARKSEKCSLRLKPFESLYCILQWAYQLYCNENSITPDPKSFESFLLNCKKEYIIVHEESGANINNAHLKELRMHHSCENDYFACHRLSPHPFNKIRTRNQFQFLSFINHITV
jgi:hypothetical protein